MATFQPSLTTKLAGKSGDMWRLIVKLCGIWKYDDGAKHVFLDFEHKLTLASGPQRVCSKIVLSNSVFLWSQWLMGSNHVIEICGCLGEIEAMSLRPRQLSFVTHLKEVKGERQKGISASRSCARSVETLKLRVHHESGSNSSRNLIWNSKNHQEFYSWPNFVNWNRDVDVENDEYGHPYPAEGSSYTIQRGERREGSSASSQLCKERWNCHNSTSKIGRNVLRNSKNSPGPLTPGPILC